MKNYCREASRLISDSYDRDLTLVERVELRFHLLACNFCRDQKHNTQQMEEILNRIQNEDPDLGICLSQADRETINNALKTITACQSPHPSSE